MRNKFRCLLMLILLLAPGVMLGCGSKDVKTERGGEESENRIIKTDNASDTEETGETAVHYSESSDREDNTSEEETTPMDKESDSSQSTDETTTNKEDTTTETKAETSGELVTEATTTVMPAATVETTENATTAPIQIETTTENYGSIINKGSYDVEANSRRGFSDNAYIAAENVINSILNVDMSELQRVRAIHDWLVINVNYDYDIANNIGNCTGDEVVFKAEGALVNKLAVCEGYSEAFLLLCWTAGIESRLIEGTGKGSPHEWNIVKVDGKWYQIDITFDDPAINGIVDTTGGNLSYDYFLITTTDMGRDHSITNCYNNSLPECSSTDYYEYAKQCTLETKFAGTPYVIISNYDQARTAVTSYNIQGIKDFVYVFVEGGLDIDTLCQIACEISANNLHYYGGGASVGAAVTYMDTVGYTIVIVNLLIN